ncbi:hypothetical protein FO519_002722 [Halicephalobus sp. NKZ332]|nr:hypothetical protein FO519_002722 [Halicephalobus sp. NKZ332]
MSWVHCNSCFLEPGKDNKNFYISNCGHILCQQCQHQKKCPSCGNEDYKALKIDSNLPSNIRDYFNDVSKMMNTATRKILDVKSFQDSQVKSLGKALLNHQGATLELQKKNLNLKAALEAAKKYVSIYEIQIGVFFRENESLTVSVKFYSDALAKKTEECEVYKRKLEDQTRLLTTPVRQLEEKSSTDCTPVKMLSESFITPKSVSTNPHRNNNAAEPVRRPLSNVSKKTPTIPCQEESPLIGQLNDSEERIKNDFLNTHAMLGLPTKAKRSRFSVDDEE